MIDDHQTVVLVHQLGHRRQIGDGAQRRRGRGDRRQPGRRGDQALPLPGRQFAGLDVHLGPFDLGAVPVRRAQPRRDVGLVVEAGEHDLVAQADPHRGGVGQRGQQHGTIGAEHHTVGIGPDEVGDRLPGRGQHRRAAPGRWVRTRRDRLGATERGRDRGGHRVGQQHPVLRVEVHPAVAQRGVQPPHPGNVVRHVSHLRTSANRTDEHALVKDPAAPRGGALIASAAILMQRARPPGCELPCCWWCSTPVVRGSVTPDGLVSLDSSRSWTKIYDNGTTGKQ